MLGRESARAQGEERLTTAILTLTGVFHTLVSASEVQCCCCVDFDLNGISVSIIAADYAGGTAQFDRGTHTPVSCSHGSRIRAALKYETFSSDLSYDTVHAAAS